ncbi:hypothetical protein DSO57_1005767 [Entomophthora muscae]|nr:hypothetical protein DSO57_1005767 [Entomophthora muscae]
MIKNGASGIIPLEPAKIFLPMLKSLEDCCDVPFYLEHGEHRADDTFHSLLEDVSQKFQTKVERPKVDWNEVHPSMVFSSLSSSINESYHLSMLLVYSIFRRDGWFKYGRLPVVMLAPPEILKGIQTASLVGFLWRAVADVETSIELSSDAFVTKRSMQAIKLIPSVVPKIQAPLETYHFILSKLMVRKAQSLSSSLAAIAPGAATIRSKLTFDAYKNCSRLTLSEVDQVTLKYIEWYKNRHGAAPIHAFV